MPTGRGGPTQTSTSRRQRIFVVRSCRGSAHCFVASARRQTLLWAPCKDHSVLLHRRLIREDYQTWLPRVPNTLLWQSISCEGTQPDIPELYGQGSAILVAQPPTSTHFQP